MGRPRFPGCPPWEGFMESLYLKILDLLWVIELWKLDWLPSGHPARAALKRSCPLNIRITVAFSH